MDQSVNHFLEEKKNSTRRSVSADNELGIAKKVDESAQKENWRCWKMIWSNWKKVSTNRCNRSNLLKEHLNSFLQKEIRVEAESTQGPSQLDVVMQAEKALNGYANGARNLMQAVQQGVLAGGYKVINSLLDGTCRIWIGPLLPYWGKPGRNSSSIPATWFLKKRWSFRSDEKGDNCLNSICLGNSRLPKWKQKKIRTSSGGGRLGSKWYANPAGDHDLLCQVVLVVKDRHVGPQLKRLKQILDAQRYSL